VDDRPLGERRVDVAYRCAGLIDPAIHPGVEDGLAGLDVVGVVLEAVDQCVLLRREAPQLAGPDAVVRHLVHLPVIRHAEFQRARREGRLGRASSQRQFLLVRAEVDVMGRRIAPGAPAQNRIDGYVGRSGRRLRLSRVRGDVQEAHLAQTDLRQHAPVVVDRQPDVLGRHARHVHCRIGRIVLRGRGLGELDIAQRGPFLTIRGVLHRDILGPEAQHRLELHVVVPDQ